MADSKIASAIKKFKAVGIIISVLLIIAGIVMFSMPAKSTIYLSIVFLAALLVNGIGRLIRYFMIPKDIRNGWMLADGIISTIISIILLVYIADAPLMTALSNISFVGYLVGFYEIFIGISQLCSIGNVKANGGSAGWAIFIGIINILCGIFVISHPILSIISFEWIIGVYLVIFGITTLIECCCAKKEN